MNNQQREELREIEEELGYEEPPEGETLPEQVARLEKKVESLKTQVLMLFSDVFEMCREMRGKAKKRKKARVN